MASKQILLITGGNSGIGYEVVKALCRSPQAYEIIIGSLVVSDGEAAIELLKKEVPQTASTVTVLQTDLWTDSSLEKAAKTIEANYGRLDVLVNNAGSAFDLPLIRGEMKMREAFNAAWDTNVVGPHVLTTYLAPLLIKSSNPRLIFVSSSTASLDYTERFDTKARAEINSSPPAGWPKKNSATLPLATYRPSKSGLNMIMREWSRVLKNDGVKVWSVDPGFRATSFAGFDPEQLKAMGAGDPRDGGEFILEVIKGERDNQVGKFINKEGIIPW